jgi:hypothetical protein
MAKGVVKTVDRLIDVDRLTAGEREELGKLGILARTGNSWSTPGLHPGRKGRKLSSRRLSERLRY